MKNYYVFFVVFLLSACSETTYENKVEVATMGTTGTIKYITKDKVSFQKQIDSLLLAVNMSLSTYIDSSTISRYNNKEISISESLKDEFFRENYTLANKIATETKQLFNPAILPLVAYWKVQNKEENTFALKIDSIKIDSIVQYINSSTTIKQYDYSALAKGFGVDVVAAFLNSKGINNYMVEIGGEVNCKGKNKANETWKIGIEEPNEQERRLYEIVSVKDKSMATSGNYRNFKVLDSGQKIVHIINPKTGYPEISNLLSASILANNCMKADAYATACMVMGVDTCFKFILSKPDIECFLIYSDKNGELQAKISEGFLNSINKR